MPIRDPCADMFHGAVAELSYRCADVLHMGAVHRPDCRVDPACPRRPGVRPAAPEAAVGE